MKDIDNDNVVVLSGAEKIVLVDDFINAPADERNSGRTIRRMLQYILIAMKAAGTPIEIEDHEGGMPKDVFANEMQNILRTLGIAGSAFVSPSIYGSKAYLRIIPRDEHVRLVEKEEKERQEREAEWSQKLHESQLEAYSRLFKQVTKNREPENIPVPIEPLAETPAERGSWLHRMMEPFMVEKKQ